jgi:hypothetical protein
MENSYCDECNKSAKDCRCGLSPLESNRAGDILQKILEGKFPRRYDPPMTPAEAASCLTSERLRFIYLIGIVNGCAEESEMFDLAIRKIAKNLEQG